MCAVLNRATATRTSQNTNHVYIYVHIVAAEKDLLQEIREPITQYGSRLRAGYGGPATRHGQREEDDRIQ